MSEHLLNGFQIGAIFQKMCCEGVAQHMRRNIFFYLCFVLVILDDFPESLAGHPVTVHVDEQSLIFLRRNNGSAGLSSSAAFSVLIARILSQLYNNNSVEDIVIARTAHSAETDHFGKPSGLTSQLVCAMGHTLYVDLKTNEIERIEDDFSDMGLTMCLTDTGGSHDGLNTSYARIPADMCYIANLFDVGVLSDVDPELFYSKGWDQSNRPVRRAMHFFAENERVIKMRDALKSHNGQEYMRLMNESGRSSETLLNNIVTSSTGDTRLLEGLERSASLLDGKGAWRVHGGGFAGCVQALMPSDFFPLYRTEMEHAFGAGKCFRIRLV